MRVVDGRVLGLSAMESGLVKACQSRVLADVDIAVDDVPHVTTGGGTLVKVIDRSPDVVELAIRPDAPVPFLPGQYFRFRFRGYPERCFSPTGGVEEEVAQMGADGLIHLHVRRVPQGRVSSALGTKIRVGHRVRVTGPYGSAYLRPAQDNRLVLVGSGTGFAPVYAVALAALQEQPDRRMMLVVGTRSLESFYMVPALITLSRHPNVSIVATVRKAQGLSKAVRTGSPEDFLPELDADDIVYVAGSPQLVETVGARAREAGAECHTDPFMPGARGLSLRALAPAWWRNRAQRKAASEGQEQNRERVRAEPMLASAR